MSDIGGMVEDKPLLATFRHGFSSSRVTTEGLIALMRERLENEAPGAEFNYHGVYSILPSYLIERETGASAEAFAAEHLFQPLGITEWEWESIASGLTDTDGGLYLRPQDMAKLGQLYLDGGTWNGERIVSEAWVAESTSRQIVNTDSPDYCLLWWCSDFHYGNRTAWTFFASGTGGQKIFVFPDLDLVVVVTQQVFDNPYDELNNLAILSRYVLPAVDPAAIHKPVSLSGDELTQFAGEFVGPHATISIVVRDGGLLATMEGTPPIELTPYGPLLFIGSLFNLIEVTFEFRPTADGRIDRVKAAFGFREKELHRINP